jgi:ankyrin repeat protein
MQSKTKGFGGAKSGAVASQLTGILVLALLSAPWVWPQTARPGGAEGPDAAAEAHIRQLIESLPPGSSWRGMLQHGARGDGVRRPWMDEMRTEGVKLAIFTLEFDWVEGGKELKDWTLVSEQYFKDYDHLQPIMDPRGLEAIKTSGLPSKLEAEALARGRHGNWVDYPAAETGTGYKQVFLADNEWLPVQMFPWFGQYERGTTPLMHAALLGDVARIKRLLREGADLNAVSPDGSTALIYAATNDNSAATECLLKAGADPNAEMKGGGNALTAAVVTDHRRNVELLLRAGMNPNVKTVEGETVLAFAVRRHFSQVAYLLKQAGARQ